MIECAQGKGALKYGEKLELLLANSETFMLLQSHMEAFLFSSLVFLLEAGNLVPPFETFVSCLRRSHHSQKKKKVASEEANLDPIYKENQGYL